MIYFAGSLDPISTRGGWTQLFEITDQDTSDLVDLTGASIVLEVRDQQYGCIVLSGTTSNGKVTITDTGTFQVSFPVSDTQDLRADTYEVGATITQNGETRQLIIGTLPIVDGIVTQ